MGSGDRRGHTGDRHGMPLHRGIGLKDGAIVRDRRDMTAYLLTWNPDRWSWDSFDEDVARAVRGEIVEMEWSTGNTNRITPGDRLFLLRQGSNRPGLIGSGHAGRAVHPGPHYLTKRRSGERALCTTVRVDSLLPVADVLPTARLKSHARLGTLSWRPFASGSSVEDELTADVELLWTNHLKGLGRPVLGDGPRFRAGVEAARPRSTPRRKLLSDRRVTNFGYRGGRHEPSKCWVYTRPSGPEGAGHRQAGSPENVGSPSFQSYTTGEMPRLVSAVRKRRVGFSGRTK